MLRVPQLEDPIAIIALACRDIPARRSTYMRLDIRLSVFSTRKAIGRHTRRDFSKSVDVPHQFTYSTTTGNENWLVGLVWHIFTGPR